VRCGIVLSDIRSEPDLQNYVDERFYREPAHFILQAKERNIAGHRVYCLEFGACMWWFMLTDDLEISQFGGKEFLLDPSGSVVLHTRNVLDVPYLRECFMKASTSGKLDGLT